MRVYSIAVYLHVGFCVARSDPKATPRPMYVGRAKKVDPTFLFYICTIKLKLIIRNGILRNSFYLRMNLRKFICLIGTGLCVALVGTFVHGCGSNVNTNNDSHFTEEGRLRVDSTEITFKRELPTAVKFYVEVSGSMNGFFRANKPTAFKADVWNVLSFFSSFASQVSILTDDGSQGVSLSLDEFRTNMNTGTFVSSASTKVPLMLQTIIDDLNTDTGEVAVLVSDMKYSPVGAAAPTVLMSQYATDINGIVGRFGKAISIIGATSDYLDKAGNVLSLRSPYYYIILGRQENVAEMRNYISLLLNCKGNFVDNIESGFIYGHPEYSFGISNKCCQLGNEPTFLGYEEADDDTCMIKLKVSLENYRWLMTNESIFSDALKVKSVYGSEIEVSNINIDVKDISGQDKQLNRTAVATVDLKIFNMPTDSEVIEWTLDLPDTNYALFNEFFDGATDENDPNKSYSVLDFLKGVFQGGIVTHDMKPNYILISKEN